MNVVNICLIIAFLLIFVCVHELYCFNRSWETFYTSMHVLRFYFRDQYKIYKEMLKNPSKVEVGYMSLRDYCKTQIDGKLNKDHYYIVKDIKDLSPKVDRYCVFSGDANVLISSNFTIPIKRLYEKIVDMKKCKFKVGDVVDFPVYMSDDEIYPKGYFTLFGKIVDIVRDDILDIVVLGGDNQDLIGEHYMFAVSDVVKKHRN